jgi:hypothetical protein
LGVTGGEPNPFPGGAARLVDGHAYVLADDEPLRALGRALAFARSVGVAPVHLSLIVDDGAGVLSRRAQLFEEAPTVWWAVGRELHRVEPEPIGVAETADSRALELAPLLEAAGAEVVVEHGVVRGEVLGLEIATVVVDGDGARVEAGVGRHDREAFAIIHGDVPPSNALASVLRTVRDQRRAGAPDHPLQRLVPERWLREIVIARPDLVGATSLARVAAPVAPSSVKDMQPAGAVGIDDRGQPVVVVCSVGVDLDLVPSAADIRHTHAPDARLVLAVPRRDDHPVTRALADSLRRPADVVAVPDDWRAAAAPVA